MRSTGARSTAAVLCLVLCLLIGKPSWATDQAASTDVIALVTAFENGSLGDAVAVKNVEVALEHLDLRLVAGSAAPLMVGDEAVGFYFSGEGTWAYITRELDELSAVRTNVKSTTGFNLRDLEPGLMIEGKFKQLLIWARGIALPDLAGEPAPDLQDAYRRHRKIFDEAKVAPSSHLFAHQVIDLPRAPVARAEIRTGSNNLVYTHDGVESRSVSLGRLRKMSFMLEHGAVFSVPLSWQPLDGDLRTFQEPICLLTHMDIDLTADKEDATLSITSTISARLRDQRVFRFELKSEVFDKFRKARRWTVNSVLDSADRKVAFYQARDELMVVMPEPMHRGAPFKLRFELSGPVLVRFGDSDYWRLWTSAWYPRFGRAGTYTTVHATVRVKKPFIPVAGGQTVERREEGDYNVVETRIDHPIQYYTITGGRYNLTEELQDGLTVRVATYALDNQRAVRKLTKLAFDIVEFYQSWLGPFPFDEFQIIEANSLGWGQAPPGMMFITAEAFTPFFHRAWSKGINHRFAHEIAHQYWGHLIKWPSPQEQWLSESFADVSAAFALKHILGQKAFNELFTAWTNNAEESTGQASVAMANRVGWATDRGFGDRTNLLYDKGPLVLFELRDRVGGRTFAQFLHGYIKLMSWKFGNTDEFMALLNRSTGKDYSEVFDRYFWGTEMPRVERPREE